MAARSKLPPPEPPTPLSRRALVRHLQAVQRTAEPPSRYLADKFAAEAGLPTEAEDRKKVGKTRD